MSGTTWFLIANNVVLAIIIGFLSFRLHQAVGLIQMQIATIELNTAMMDEAAEKIRHYEAQLAQPVFIGPGSAKRVDPRDIPPEVRVQMRAALTQALADLKKGDH